MTTRPTPSRTVPALVAGVATTLYYATPDVISSRRARGWVKAGLTAVSLAAAVPDLQAAWATGPGQQATDGEALVAPAFGSLPAARKALPLAPVAAVSACSAAGLLAAERWVFRHGRTRAAAGKRLPHTGPALLYGTLASALWLLPTPARTH